VVAIVGSFLFTLWLSQRRLERIEVEIYEVAANAEPSIVHIEDARMELERIGRYTDEYVVAVADRLQTAPESRANAIAARRRMREALEAYERLPFFPGEDALYQEARRDLAPVDEATQKLLEPAEAGDLDASTLELVNVLHPDIERASERLKAIVDHDTRHAVAELEAIGAGRRHSWVVAVIGGGLSLALSLLATLAASRALWDAARRQRAVDEERGARLSAEKELRRRDQFLALAGHELRTPLTALRLATDALTRRAEPAASGLLSTAARQVRRMNDLVEDLLLLAQIELDALALEPSAVDLVALARARIEALAADIQRSKSTVHLHGDPAAPGRWDPAALRRVIDKLVGNAIKFGESRPIDVTVSTEGDRARLVVRDRGIGIPAGRLEAVFDRLERGVSERTYSGLGLGLYLARSLVRAMGGSIEAESSPAIGTAVTVVLPLEKAPG
jgi:signal transduction histidine kinase